MTFRQLCRFPIPVSHAITDSVIPPNLSTTSLIPTQSRPGLLFPIKKIRLHLQNFHATHPLLVKILTVNNPAAKKIHRVRTEFFSKIFSRAKNIFQKLFKNFSKKKNSRPGHNKSRHRNSRVSRRKPLQKPPPGTPYFRDPHHPQSGPCTAPDSPLFRNGALYAPGLGSADPLYGAKLLEVFA